jgi:HK97 family phage major capsid protein
MALPENITAKQAELVAARDTLVELTAKMAEGEDDGVAVEEATRVVKKLSDELDTLKNAEAAIAKSLARTSVSSPAVVTSHPKMKGANGFVKAAICAFESKAKGVSIDDVINTRYGNDEAAGMFIRHVTKAAQNPAMTNVPAYLGDLTEQNILDFQNKLYAEVVVPRLALNRFTFDGYQSLKVPMRSQAATPNAAAAFRAEGAPIRVGAISLSSLTLTPKSAGVILTVTEEMLERSTVAIEPLFERAIIDDTAAFVDGLFFSNTAGSATAPAGILNGIAAGNTAASAGNTAANIVADLRGRMQAMAAANLGKRPTWIMNPARAWGLQLALTAAGTPLFPEMANGTLLGIPVVTSTAITASDVFLIDAAEVYFAMQGPRFRGSFEATLHEEDTTPLQIGTAGTPATVAAPVRSLYQTATVALRAMYEMDWQIARAGSVQHLSAVAW